MTHSLIQFSPVNVKYKIPQRKDFRCNVYISVPTYEKTLKRIYIRCSENFKSLKILSMMTYNLILMSFQLFLHTSYNNSILNTQTGIKTSCMKKKFWIAIWKRILFMQETDQTNIDASIDLMYNISLQTIIQDRLGFQLTFFPWLDIVLQLLMLMLLLVLLLLMMLL